MWGQVPLLPCTVIADSNVDDAGIIHQVTVQSANYLGGCVQAGISHRLTRLMHLAVVPLKCLHVHIVQTQHRLELLQCCMSLAQLMHQHGHHRVDFKCHVQLGRIVKTGRRIHRTACVLAVRTLEMQGFSKSHGRLSSLHHWQGANTVTGGAEDVSYHFIELAHINNTPISTSRLVWPSLNFPFDSLHSLDFP